MDFQAVLLSSLVAKKICVPKLFGNLKAFPPKIKIRNFDSLIIRRNKHTLIDTRAYLHYVSFYSQF